MDSLVLQLQRLAMDSKAAVADVLRTALVVATKLGVPEMREWCEAEIRGYKGKEVPEYRRIEGQVRAWNPQLGGFIPVLSQDAEVTKALATRSVVQPIAEIEKLLEGRDSAGVLQMPFSPSVINQVFANTEAYQLGIIPTVLIGRTQMFGVVEAVRNAVLEWALKLEKDGILGEGMTFSQAEKGRAGAITYNIENFSGVLGNVTGDSVQVGDYNTLHAVLKRRGVSQAERNELETVLDGLPNADPDARKSLLARGSAWLGRNAANLGTLSDTIRGWFEALGGGPAA